MRNSRQEPILVGEGITEVENPVELLRHQDGTFKVTSPHGYVFQVSCRRGRKIRVREIGDSQNAGLSGVAHHERFDGSGYEPIARRWRIEKIA